jgi:hypothetical protein
MPGEDINIPIRALRNDATSNGLCRVYFGSQSLNLDPCCYAIVLLRRCIRSHAFSGTPRAGKLLSVEVGVDAIPVAGHVNGHGDDGGRVYEILQWSLRYTYDIDVCRNRLGLPYHSPSREDLLEFRERPRATFPLSESHNRLYQEFILSSRSSKRQYDQTVKRRHG